MNRAEKKALKLISRSRRSTMTKAEVLLKKVISSQELSTEEQTRWERYNYVVDLRINGYTKRHIAKLIAEKWGVSMAYAYEVFKDASELFFLQNNIDRKYERNFIAEQLLQMASDAREKGELEFAKSCLESAGKFMQLDKPDESIPPTNMPVILFTSDPRFASGQDNIIDIDHQTEEQHGGETE